MQDLQELFDNNREWAAALTEADPDFFKNLAEGQNPPYLWIGCSDSRAPANDIIGTAPGEAFVHRNIANLMVADDVNAMSVLQYAVDVVKISHIIVCGHTGCGGIHAALHHETSGPIDDWLQPIRDLHEEHRDELAGIADQSDRLDRMSELNVHKQAANIVETSTVKGAWRRGQPLEIHGWMYEVREGLLRDLSLGITGPRR